MPVSLHREVLAYRNAYVAVYDDEVRMPDGSPGRYLRIVEGDGRPGVVGLAVHDGQFALVHVYRYPLGSWEWGLPRGFGQHDDPAESMVHELEEELGARPDTVTEFGEVAPNSGILASRVKLFLASYSVRASQPRDTFEVEQIRWVGPAELSAEIASGAITDGFTLSAYGLAVAKGLVTIS